MKAKARLGGRAGLKDIESHFGKEAGGSVGRKLICIFPASHVTAGEVSPDESVSHHAGNLGQVELEIARWCEERAQDHLKIKEIINGDTHPDIAQTYVTTLSL